jgi:hypothetical protein
MADDTPIACTLQPADLRDRRTWIADVNRALLRGAERGDLSLVLRYAPQARADVERLADLERACCAFLTYEVTADDREVVLKITAPERARVAAETMFDQLQQGGARRGCCG